MLVSSVYAADFSVNDGLGDVAAECIVHEDSVDIDRIDFDYNANSIDVTITVKGDDSGEIPSPPSSHYAYTVFFSQQEMGRVNLRAYGDLICFKNCENPSKNGNTVSFRWLQEPPVSERLLRAHVIYWGTGDCRTADNAEGYIGGESGPVCGNGIKEEGEQCDGNDLGGQSCLSLGYDSGVLSCGANCNFDVSGCYYDEPEGCQSDGECDDGIGCTVDSCVNEICQNVPDDELCSKEMICDVNVGCKLVGEEPYCDENWQCGSWGKCFNGVEIRTCNDLSNCGTIVNKPITERSCDEGVEEIPVEGEGIEEVISDEIEEEVREDIGERCSPGERSKGRYCGSDGRWHEQKDEGASCEEGYECESNLCIDGKCEKKGFLNRIIGWFRELFAVKEVKEKKEEKIYEEIPEGKETLERMEELAAFELPLDVFPYDGIGQVEPEEKAEGYILKFDKPELEPLAMVYGDLKGKVSKNTLDAALIQRKQEIEEEQERVKQELSTINPDAYVVHEYTTVFSGMAIQYVTEDELKELKEKFPYIKVHPNLKVYATLMDSVPIIRADEVWPRDENMDFCDDSGEECLTGGGMTIAIIDTGVDYTHPDLGSCTEQEFLDGVCEKVVGGWDFVNNDNNPMDDKGHGTHCAATAAGNGDHDGDGVVEEGEGLHGVAPDAKIYAYKVLSSEGSGTEGDIMEAIERSVDPNEDGLPDDHLDVISLSLGAFCGKQDYSEDCGPDDPMSQTVDNTVVMGVVAVIAAGNSGCGCGGGIDAGTITSPGTSRRAITVAASTKGETPEEEEIADFSSRGPIEWQGENISKPDVAAPGVDICAAQWDNWKDEKHCLDTEHISISGTSMATPHVAGAAALLLQRHPNWYPQQVKTALQIGAVDIGFGEYDQGAGRIDSFSSVELEGVPVWLELLTSGEIRGVVEVLGLIPEENFSNYSLEIEWEYDPENWHVLVFSEQYPEDDLLYVWDTNPLPDGHHRLRLSAYFDYGEDELGFGKDERNVYIYNTDIFTEGEISGIINVRGHVPVSFSYRLDLDGITLIDTDVYPENYTLLENWDTRTFDDDDYDLKLTTYNDTEPEFGTETSGIEINNIKIKSVRHEDVEIASWARIIWVGEDDDPVVEFIGTVDALDFEYYVLEWGFGEDVPGESAEGITLENGGTQPVYDDVLGSWDTSVITEPSQSGYYTIELKAYASGQLVDSEAAVIYVDREQQQGWPVEIDDVRVMHSPRIADLDNDGKKEVIIGTGYQEDGWLYVINYDGSVREGWPVNTPWTKGATPAIADLDFDGYKEIIYPLFGGYRTGQLAVFRHDGTMQEGWPQEMEYYCGGGYFFEDITDGIIPTSPSIGDIDNDGDLEIVFIDRGVGNGLYHGDWGIYGGMIYVWHHNGIMMEGWPVRAREVPVGWGDSVGPSSVGLADIIGDGNLEVIALVYNFSDPFISEAHIYDKNGSLLEGWDPKYVGKSWRDWELATGDIDEGGNLEIIGAVNNEECGCVGTTNPAIWYANGSLLKEFNLTFPNVGNERINKILIDDLTYDGIKDFVLFANWKHLGVTDGLNDELYWVHQLEPHYSQWYSPFALRSISPIIVDINNDGLQDVVKGVDKIRVDTLPRIYAYSSDGTPLEGFPKTTHYGFDFFNLIESTPAVDDLDGDGDSEIVIAGPDGRVYAYDLLDIKDDTPTSPTMRHDFFNTNLFEDMYHNECDGENCIEVYGPGPDWCSDNEDCINPTHRECVDMTCQLVSGFGANECTANEDCYYYGCLYGECIELPCPLRTDTCSCNEDCSRHVFGFSDDGDDVNPDIPEENHDSLDIIHGEVDYSQGKYSIEVKGDGFGDMNLPSEGFAYRYLFESGRVRLHSDGSLECDGCSSPVRDGNTISFFMPWVEYKPGDWLLIESGLIEFMDYYEDYTPADSARYMYLPVCGNGVIEQGEECDGDYSVCLACEYFGFPGGTLGCVPPGETNECSYDLSRCNECAGQDDGTPCRDDGNECTEDYCLSERCAHVPGNEGQPCDDGLWCTEGNTCVDGDCGVPRVCEEEDSIDCTIPTCVEELQECWEIANDDYCGYGMFCSPLGDDECISNDFEIIDELGDAKESVPEEYRSTLDIKSLRFNYGDLMTVAYEVKGEGAGGIVLPPSGQFYYGYSDDVFGLQYLELYPDGSVYCPPELCGDESALSVANRIYFRASREEHFNGENIEARTGFDTDDYPSVWRVDDVEAVVGGTECIGQPDGEECDDGIFCNGNDECLDEICVNVGPEPCHDDGWLCTMDCDEINDICVDNIPDSAYCGDREVCNPQGDNPDENGCVWVGGARCSQGHIDNGDGTCTAIFPSPTVDGYIGRHGVYDLYFKYNYMEDLRFYTCIDCGNFLYRTYVEWDVGSIPDNAEILSSNFKYHGLYHDINLHGRIREMKGARPLRSGNQEIHDEAGEGTKYYEPLEHPYFPIMGPNQELNFGEEIISDIESQLNTNWFAIGIQNVMEGAYTPLGTSIFSQDVDSEPPPTLQVLYSYSCTTDQDCFDGNVCTDYDCNENTGECIYTPNNNDCDNGLWCDGNDQCSGGSCVNVGPGLCEDDGIYCTRDCDEEDKECLDHIPEDDLCGPGAECDPDNPNSDPDTGCVFTGDYECPEGHINNGDGTCTGIFEPVVDGFIAHPTGNPNQYDNFDSLTYLAFYYCQTCMDSIYRTYVEWDISSIPDDSAITDIDFQYHGETHYDDYHGRIREMKNARPSTAGAQEIYDEAGEGLVYYEPDEEPYFPEIGPNKEVVLNNDAVSDLEFQLLSDWFAFGVQNIDESPGVDFAVGVKIHSLDFTGAEPKPTLVVNYVPGSGGDECEDDSDCNDNNICTDDSCNTDVGECVFTPNNNDCDDGLFCNGDDTCQLGECVHSGDPCEEDETCDEYDDMCVPQGEECTDDDNDNYDACDVNGEPILGCSDPCDCDDRPDGEDGIPDNEDDGENINPGADEVCDGIDNNCNGEDDDGEDETWYGQETSCGLGVCESTGFLDCVDGGQFDTCEEGEPTGNDDNCNGIDEDCDGTSDNNYVPDESCFLPGECANENQASSCESGNEIPCQTGTPEDEICDGLDNDCDYGIDEDFLDDECQYVCIGNGHDWVGNGGSLNCCGDDSQEDSPYEISELSCDDGNDNDCNAECDYDSSSCDHGDINCPVEIISIWASDTNPIEYSYIEARCTSSAANVNSIEADVSGDGTCWFTEVWDGNEAVFDCNVGSTGVKTVTCGVDLSKSYQQGTDKSVDINVLPSECSDYSIEGECNLDYRCEWCLECYNNKYSGGADRCVELGSCVYNCLMDMCGAECDNTNGGWEDYTCDYYCVDNTLYVREDVENMCYDDVPPDDCTASNDQCEQGTPVDCGISECSLYYENTIGYCDNPCNDDGIPDNGEDASCGVCIPDFNLNCRCEDNYHNIDGLDYNGCEYYCVYEGDEICDGIDNNCDGDIDENNGDCSGNMPYCLDGVCVECLSNNDCDDSVDCTDDYCDGLNRCFNDADDSDCDNELYCDGLEYCDAELDCQGGTPIDCSDNNIDEVAMCFYIPDDNQYTWDYREEFISECLEPGQCTEGDDTISHTCSIELCEADCETNVNCDPTDCDYLDGCVDNDYYDYDDVANTCESDCGCTSNECGDPTIYYNDPACTDCQNDDECDTLDRDYCDGDLRKHDEGRCVDYECTVETILIEDCNDYNNDYCDGTEIKRDDYTCYEFECVIGQTITLEDCDNGDFCDGEESCLNAECIAGEYPCDDLIYCTDDLCDEDLDECDYEPNDELCDEDEICDPDDENANDEGCVYVGVCGNGELEPGEDCECGDDLICGTEDDDLDGETCESQDYPDGGDLECSEPGTENECNFDYSGCSLYPAYDNFDGETTDFVNEDDITQVENAILEIIIYGKISFEAEILDFSRLDLDSYVFIGDRLISIDTTAQEGRMNNLNAPAVLSFYGVNLENPVIMRDGEECTECTVVSYENGTYIVQVPGFSEYTVEEEFTETGDPGGPGGGPGGRRRTRECNDRIDNDNDGLIDYPQDPGCVGRYDNSEYDISEIGCREDWLCYPYSECIDDIQSRECFDMNNCDTFTRKPITERECGEEPIVSIPPSEEEIPEKLSKRKIVIFSIIIILFVLGAGVEEIFRRRRLNRIKERHKKIYDLIKLAEKNIKNKSLARFYYNKLRNEAERHRKVCDKKEFKYIRKEIVDLYEKLRRKPDRKIK